MNLSFNLDFDLKYFWAWTDFQSYLDFMLALWFIGAIITYFMLPFKIVMESVGFFAVFIEAMLGKCEKEYVFISFGEVTTRQDIFLVRHP